MKAIKNRILAIVRNNPEAHTQDLLKEILARSFRLEDVEDALQELLMDGKLIFTAKHRFKVSDEA